MSSSIKIRLILLLGVILALTSGGGADILPSNKATAAVYVYEKDTTAVPSGVQGGINRIKRELGLAASVVDDDVTDGAGHIPEQYAVAIPAAREHGLPCLVVLVDDDVLKIVEVQTEEDVMEAVR